MRDDFHRFLPSERTWRGEGCRMPMDRRGARSRIAKVVVGAIVLASCANSPREGEAREHEEPEYYSCEELGERRFAAEYCVRAEGVHLQDTPFMLCPLVMVNPTPDLYVRLDQEALGLMAVRMGWEMGTFEVRGNEGTSALVGLDVCVVQQPWSAVDRRWYSDSVSVASLDSSRPFRMRVQAARGLSVRRPGAKSETLMDVGEWPRRTEAPPVEWSGHPGCSELPARFTSPTACVRGESVIVRDGDDAIQLCDRVTLFPSARLLGALRARVADRVRVNEPSERRFVEIEDEAGEYVATIEACVLDSEFARDRSGEPRKSLAGLVDPRYELNVEIERARFRYRFGAEETFHAGEIAEASAGER